jgi:HPt (histidine-containing phosphotransfer) domain-containing protein
MRTPGAGNRAICADIPVGEPGTLHAPHAHMANERAAPKRTIAPAAKASCTGGFCEALLSRVGGDRGIFVELCDIFLDDAPKRLAAIRAALGSGDAQALRAAAHAFKGSAGVFDADAIVAAARQLEQLGGQGDLTAAPPLVETLEARTRELIAEIEMERADRRWTSS